MTTLFILDYNGTLDTLPDPVEFIRTLRQKHPDAHVFVSSGFREEDLPQNIVRAAHGFLRKPWKLSQAKTWTVGRVVCVDDDALLLRGAGRILSRVRIEHVLLGPEGLLPLIQE